MSVSGTYYRHAQDWIYNDFQNDSLFVQGMALAALQQRVQDWSDVHPALVTPWQEGQLGEKEVLELIDQTLQSAELEEELWVPRVGAREATAFHPGYGLLPCPDRAVWTRIAVGSERFPKVVFVLRTMKRLVEEGRRTTKRDIFYENFAVFSNQAEVDRLVAELVALLQVPRLELGVVATSKGLVVGDLSYLNSEGIMVDCSLTVGGDSIPQDVPELRDLRTRANFLLVVEKDAVFQRLLEEGVFEAGLPPFIMVTGKGVPDLATRQLVYRLSTQFVLPVVILTDCDPYGFEIALTYKFGSLAMAWAPERLAVPSAIWLGLLPSDLGALDIEEESMRLLSREDRKKIQDLHLRDYINDFCPQLIEELEILWRVGRKAEIQQVASERFTQFHIN